MSCGTKVLIFKSQSWHRLLHEHGDSHREVFVQLEGLVIEGGNRGQETIMRVQKGKRKKLQRNSKDCCERIVHALCSPQRPFLLRLGILT